MLSTLPLPTAKANPDEAIKTYFEVCEPFTTGDILDAIRGFIAGTVPGVNPTFAPSSAQLATHIRSLEEARNRSMALHQAARQQLLARDRDEDFEAYKTPDVRARVRRMMDEFEAAQQEAKKETPAQMEARLERIRKTDQHFAGEFLTISEQVKISKTLAAKLGHPMPEEQEYLE